MVTPCHRQRLVSADAKQTGERHRVLGVDVLAQRREHIYDQVDVVHVPAFDRTTVGAEVSSDRQPARQGASKAMGQNCSHRFRRSARIVLVQQGREHAAW